MTVPFGCRVVRPRAAPHLTEVYGVLRLAIGIFPLAMDGHGTTFRASTFNADQALAALVVGMLFR
jgi:hypothetical protein